MPQPTPAGRQDSAAAFSFPAVRGKKGTAAFGGGRLTSDGGVVVLAQAERMMRICVRLAACLADPRDPSRVVHWLEHFYPQPPSFKEGSRLTFLPVRRSA